MMSEHDAHTAYADQACQVSVPIAVNEPVATDTYRLRLACPEIAERVVPGQFVMLRLSGTNDPLLGRPLAVYDVVRDAQGRAVAIDVEYLTVGRMTRRLAALPAGTLLDVWGPLGNGFPLRSARHVLIVAGGIGVTPFLMLAREYLGQQCYGSPARQMPRAERVSLCYGAKSRESLAGLDDFRRAGVGVHVSTDDGSFGHAGLVIDLVEPLLRPAEGVATAPDETLIVACGPERMLKAVAELADRRGVPCLLSLETPMACGIGICFSCVAKIRDASGAWDYRRTCVEGPIFDARDVEL